MILGILCTGYYVGYAHGCPHFGAAGLGTFPALVPVNGFFAYGLSLPVFFAGFGYMG